MALTQKQQEHPRFMAISHAVSEALIEVAARFDISEADLRSAALPLNQVDKAVDDTVSVLLKAYDINHS